MPEQNKCASVVPSTLAKAGAAIKQHQENEEKGEFNAVIWARALLGKAMIKAQAEQVEAV